VTQATRRPHPLYSSVRYVPVVRLDGSGEPLSLRGGFLEVVVRAPTHDQDDRPVLSPTRLRPDFPALREVNAPGSFEGQTTAGIGVTRKVGFRVFELTSPTRIVVDLAHPQPVDDGVVGNPRGLTITPASGPVGTKVIVEGRGCGNLDEPVRLVFQSGSGGTVGAVDLGEFPVSEQDAFRATEVTIPARMVLLQGVGGGPTRPGTYQFATRPPVCAATFTVTGDAAGAPEIPGTLPFTGSHTPLLLAIGIGLVAAGIGLVLLVRRPARPTA
jgi:hypothetical protein